MEKKKQSVFLRSIFKGENWSLGFILSYTGIHPLSQMLRHMADPSSSHLFSRVMCFLSSSCLAKHSPKKPALGNDNKSRLNRLFQSDPCHAAFKQGAEKSFYYFACIIAGPFMLTFLNSSTPKQMITLQKFAFVIHFFSVHVSHRRWRNKKWILMHDS